MMRTRWMLPALAMVGVVAGCAGESEHEPGEAERIVVTGTPWTVTDTTLASTFEASGVARPVADATLSTKLMGQVVGVEFREGDRVAAGQPLVRIDADDLAAKRAQVEASIREAQAVVRDAETQATRMRALFAEDAAPRVQLDAAETGLERARARLATARAAAAELDATARYAVVRAPFDGLVTARMVDPGDFAAPGAPVATVVDDRQLRITASAAPDAVASLARGDTLDASVEGVDVAAVVEGVVPSASGSLYTVNALVDNAAGRLLSGSAATLSIPQASRRALVIPEAAVIRRGDLTGVRLRADGATPLRWIRLGTSEDGMVEVLGGLRAGDTILIPETAASVARSGEEG